MTLMNQFSEHVISLANSENGGITNLQLQKVIYFSLGEYLKENGIDGFINQIYDEQFEAWPYGPVLRSEYFINKKYGRYNIQKPGVYRPDFQPLDKYVREYVKEDINELVEVSHRHRKWYENKEAILRHQLITYNLEDIYHDFTSQ